MRKIWVLLLSCIVGIMMAGCGGEDKAAKKENSAKEETVKVNHKLGEAEIPADPKRIVDLSGAAEELIIMGLTPVAHSNTYKEKTFSHVEEELKDSTPVGDPWMGEAKAETIASLTPDLIILNERSERLYEQMSKVAPTIVLKNPMFKWRDRFEELAGYLNKDQEYQEWMKQYDERAAELSAQIKEKYQDKTFMFLATAPSSYRLYGDYGYSDILFNDLKLQAVEGTPKGDKYKELSLEGISKYNPDYIYGVSFAGSEQLAEELKKSPVWNNLKAVQEKEYQFVNLDLIMEKAYSPIGKKELMEEIAKELSK